MLQQQRCVTIRTRQAMRAPEAATSKPERTSSLELTAFPGRQGCGKTASVGPETWCDAMRQGTSNSGDGVCTTVLADWQQD